MTHHEKTPKHSDDQSHPEPERLVTPQEEAGMELEELENPPQAEGPREDRGGGDGEEDGGGDRPGGRDRSGS